MVYIIKQEISFDDSLKKKLEFICDFCNHDILDDNDLDSFIKDNYEL